MAQPPTIRLICWNEKLAAQRASEIEAAGFAVNGAPFRSGPPISQFTKDPPAAIVIDLDRLPAHGMTLGVVLRRSKARTIPLVFAGGLLEKVERVRGEIPDACYTQWPSIRAAIRGAIKNPPVNPVLPRPHMSRYEGSGLVRKLGLKPQMQCALLGAPPDFVETLDDLPDGLEFRKTIGKETSLALWWVRSRQQMELAVDYSGLHLPRGASVWIIYPKKSGRTPVDFVLPDVRAAASQAGMVDHKICAIDKDWTGLKFARRKQ